MKTVAVIAPQFVPCSYPPSHRVRFFTNYFQEFGYKPVVLCVDQQYMEEPPDWDFVKMVPEELEIIKTKALSPKWTRKFGIGDIGIRSYKFMLKQVREMVKTRKVDLLFIPGPPWHTFCLGPKIKQEFGIPYIIDYIDPWVMSLGNDGRWWTKAYWFRKMALALEPNVVRQADHIIAVSDGTNDEVHERYSFSEKEKYTGIPYGGEPKDFDFLRSQPRQNPYWDSKDGKFHFVYVGAMLPMAYETLEALFEALLVIKKEQPEKYNNIHLHFFGTTYDPNVKKGLVEPTAERIGVEDIVTERPKRIPYLDANNLLCQADAIIGLGTTERHYTASKIFPCILAGKPLLPMYHEASTVVEYVNQTGNFVITYNDEERVASRIDQIKERILKLYERPPYTAGSETAFESLSARSMSQKLCQIFDQVLNNV